MEVLLNFAHPLTSEQLEKVTDLIGEEPAVKTIKTHITHGRRVADVAKELVDAAEKAGDGIRGVDWRIDSVYINPPGLAPLALAVVAEIRRRYRYLPSVIVIRPIEGSTPPRYEVSEIVHLNQIER